jgi:predicted nucleic acid-binding protein
VLIVSNTSPISNLAKVGQLSLMEALYGRILIPRAVYEELLDERAGETVIAAVKSSTWIEVRFSQNQLLVDELRTRINIGEAEAITLADEVNFQGYFILKTVFSVSRPNLQNRSAWAIFENSLVR